MYGQIDDGAKMVLRRFLEVFVGMTETCLWQFTLLLDPNLPDKYEEDPLLVAYVVSCTVVIFFFMLNFLLAVRFPLHIVCRRKLRVWLRGRLFC